MTATEKRRLRLLDQAMAALTFASHDPEVRTFWIGVATGCLRSAGADAARVDEAWIEEFRTAADRCRPGALS